MTISDDFSDGAQRVLRTLSADYMAERRDEILDPAADLRLSTVRIAEALIAMDRVRMFLDAGREPELPSDALEHLRNRLREYMAEAKSDDEPEKPF